MAKSTESISHVDLTTPATNKVGPIIECRSLCLLSKSASKVSYKDKKVGRDRKISQYLKSPYVDPNNLRKRVDTKTDIES